MSDKNKQIVEKVNAAFAEGNNEAWLEYCADDVVWTMVGEKTSNGKRAIREWMSSMGEMGPPKFTVDKVVAEGDSVICYGDMTMEGEYAGKYSYCDIYTFADDKIKELRSYVVKNKEEGEADRAKAA